MPLLNRKRSWPLLAAVLVALLGIGADPAGAASGGTPSGLMNTQEVYAAFTLNLTRFITWPESAFAAPDAPFIIGTFPRDPINEEIDRAVEGDMVEKHPIRTLRIQSLEDLAKCHVVFLSRGVVRPAVIARVASKPILTVSDADGFLELGGHVRFVPQATGTRLRISADNLKASGLESRAQLLRLASVP